jgi:hypothetical protein
MSVDNSKMRRKTRSTSESQGDGSSRYAIAAASLGLKSLATSAKFALCASAEALGSVLSNTVIFLKRPDVAAGPFFLTSTRRRWG